MSASTDPDPAAALALSRRQRRRAYLRVASYRAQVAERDARIVSLLAEGLSYREIGQRVGVCHGTVGRLVRAIRSGLVQLPIATDPDPEVLASSRRQHRQTYLRGAAYRARVAERDARIASLLAQGLSYREVARRVGVSRDVVVRLVRSIQRGLVQLPVRKQGGPGATPPLRKEDQPPGPLSETPNQLTLPRSRRHQNSRRS